MKAWKMTTGLFILILGIGLVLAGCSGSNNDATSQNESDQAPSAETKEPKSEELKAEEEKEERRGKITASIYDRGSVPPEAGTIEENNWTQWLNENGPTDVEFVSVPRWESRQKFNTMFASGSAPDLIFEYNTSIRNQLISQKQLMSVDELIEKYSTEYKAFLDKYPIVKKVANKEDGKMYEFGRVNGMQANHAMWIRTDWLENLNLEVPGTTEELLDVIKAFTEDDPDGNGQDDTLGIALSFVSGINVDAMFQNLDYSIQGGELTRAWDQAKAAMEFKKTIYDNGWVDKDFLADKNGEKAKQDFITGKLGIYGVNGGGSGGGYPIFEALIKNNPDAKVMAIPLPAGPFGQFSPTINNPVQMTASVNAAAKDPEAVMKYVDFLVREETQKTLAFGIEGVHYKIGETGCPEDIDEEKNKLEKDWNVDFTMLNSIPVLGECGEYLATLDMSNPVDKAYAELVKQAEAAYLSPERPMAHWAHNEHKPQMPNDIQLIATNVDKAVQDTSLKAIVSGDAYTVEQAFDDMKSAYKNGGGEKVDEWYANWYRENKDKAITTEDIYNTDW